MQPPLAAGQTWAAEPSRLGIKPSRMSFTALCA